MKVLFNNFFIELYFLECSSALGLSLWVLARVGFKINKDTWTPPQAKVLVLGRGKNQVGNSCRILSWKTYPSLFIYSSIHTSSNQSINQPTNQPTHPYNVSSRGQGLYLIFSYISNTWRSAYSSCKCTLPPGLCQPLCQVLIYAGVRGRHIPVLPLWYNSLLESQMNKYIYNYKMWFC